MKKVTIFCDTCGKEAIDKDKYFPDYWTEDIKGRIECKECRFSKDKDTEK